MLLKDSTQHYFILFRDTAFLNINSIILRIKMDTDLYYIYYRLINNIICWYYYNMDWYLLNNNE